MCHITTQIISNIDPDHIGSDNGLLPAKLLAEPMLLYHQMYSACGLHMRAISQVLMNLCILRLYFWISFHISEGQMSPS